MAASLERDDPRQPLDPFSRGVVALTFIFVCVTLIANLPEVVALLRGRVSASPRFGDTHYFIFRSSREVLLLIIVLYLAYNFSIAKRRFYVTLGAFQLFLITALWAMICTFYSIAVNDLQPLVPLLGLRIFQYTPFLLGGYVVARKNPRLGLLKFADLLRWYVAVIVIIVVLEIAFARGRSTFFGARAFGVFPNFNTFGATLVACSLWFLCARISHAKVHGTRNYEFWLVVCAALALTSGSRTASTLTLMAVALATYPRLGKRLKALALAFIPLVVVVLPFVLSATAVVSHDAVRSNRARLEILQEVVASFENPADLIFGFGLGLSSPSVVVIFGKDQFPGQIGNAHSAYLEIAAGFGMVGLISYLCFFFVSIKKGANPEMLLFFIIVGALGIPINPWGLFPAGALLLFLWGHLLGVGASEASPAKLREREGDYSRIAGGANHGESEAYQAAEDGREGRF